MNDFYPASVVESAVKDAFREINTAQMRRDVFELKLTATNPVLALELRQASLDSYDKIVHGLVVLSEQPFHASLRGSEVMEICRYIFGACKQIHHLIDCTETEYRCLNGLALEKKPSVT